MIMASRFLQTLLHAIGCGSLLVVFLAGCSEHHDEFPGLPDPEAAALNPIPSANSLAYGVNTDSGTTVLKGEYKFEDPADLDDNSTYYWLADGEIIEGETTTTLDITKPLITTGGNLVDITKDEIKFCVRPTNSIGNSGTPICSDPFDIKPPDGGDGGGDGGGDSILPPTATNLTYTPAAGPVLNGTYTFTDPQSLSDASSYYWLADGVPITGATQTTLNISGTLTNKDGDTVDLTTQAIKFCVRPINSGSAIGTDACSPPIVAVPSATNLSYTPTPVTPGATLTGSYTFNDTFGLADDSDFYWLADGVIINGANLQTLDTSVALTDANGDPVIPSLAIFSFCVTPKNTLGITGAPVCVSPPTASGLGITIGSGTSNVPPTEGETLTPAYIYTPGMDNSPDGNSVGVWKIDGTASTTCTPASSSCTHTIASTDIGKTIEFCVSPVSQSGMIGPEVCSPQQIKGVEIKMIGQLVYTRTLTATIRGYDFTKSYWQMDLDDTTGPLSDDNPVELVDGTNTPPAPIPVNSHGLITGLNTANSSFTIGTQVMISAASFGGADGFVDDFDWYGGGFAQPVLNANHYVGKDIEFCVETVNYGLQCVSAAESQAAGGTACTDQTQCVFGGIYYGNSLTSRGVEPRRLATRTTGTWVAVSRPITSAEIALSNAGDLPFGTSLPTADSTTIIAGIEYPLYTHTAPSSISKAVTLCLNFSWYDHISKTVSSDWGLPVPSNSTPDAYIGAPNNNVAPTASAVTLANFATGTYRRDPGNTLDLSAALGFPLSVPVWNADSTGTIQNRTDLGLSATNVSGSGPAAPNDMYLVSCSWDTGLLNPAP